MRLRGGMSGAEAMRRRFRAVAVGRFGKHPGSGIKVSAKFLFYFADRCGA